jgi:uncharacterized lipoprotein YmbA
MVRTSPTQIEYYALDRWAGGLEEQLDEKLRSEFEGSSKGVYRVRIDGVLMAFEQADVPTGAEARVKLDTRIEVSGGGLSPGGHSFTRLYVGTQPAASASAAAVVEALSRTVETIAADMAADILQFAKAELDKPGSN